MQAWLLPKLRFAAGGPDNTRNWLAPGPFQLVNRRYTSLFLLFRLFRLLLKLLP